MPAEFSVSASRCLRDSWKKSPYSSNTGCVEARRQEATEIAVRDSKDPASAVITFSAGAWRRFLVAVRQDAFTA